MGVGGRVVKRVKCSSSTSRVNFGIFININTSGRHVNGGRSGQCWNVGFTIFDNILNKNDLIVLLPTEQHREIEFRLKEYEHCAAHDADGHNLKQRTWMISTIRKRGILQSFWAKKPSQVAQQHHERLGEQSPRRTKIHRSWRWSWTTNGRTTSSSLRWSCEEAPTVEWKHY